MAVLVKTVVPSVRGVEDAPRHRARGVGGNKAKGREPMRSSSGRSFGRFVQQRGIGRHAAGHSGSGAGPRLDIDRATMQRDERAYDGEPETDAAMAGAGGVSLETVEDPVLDVFRDTTAMVDDLEDHLAALAEGVNLDDLTSLGKADGIRHQVVECLPQTLGIADDAAGVIGDDLFQTDPRFREPFLKAAYGTADEVGHAGRLAFELEFVIVDRSQIETIPKGLDNRKGHIGFAGHSDPVAFRSFKVKPLPSN